MSWRCARLGFFGRRLVGPMLDGSHHGEGEHDEGDMAVPAMPGAGLVMIEAEFILGSLKTILDSPAMTFHRHQLCHRRALGTPSGWLLQNTENKEFKFKISYVEGCKGFSQRVYINVIVRFVENLQNPTPISEVSCGPAR